MKGPPRSCFPAAVATLALTALLGCPKHLPIARAYQAPTADELAGVLAAKQQAVLSMNARARATSWLGGERVRATVLMLLERGGRLRFEAEVSLQGTVAVLVTDGRQFTFLDTVRNELRQGPACPANVASLIRIPLAPAEVAAILLGDARLPAGVDPASGVVDWDADRGADVLSVRRHDGWLRFLFQRSGGTTRLVGAIAAGPDHRPRWRTTFEDFTDVPTAGAAKGADVTGATGATGATAPSGQAPAARSVSLPGTIRFAEGDTSFDEGVEIKFKERTINEPTTDEAFALPVPAGTTILHVGCPPGSPPPVR